MLVRSTVAEGSSSVSIRVDHSNVGVAGHPFKRDFHEILVRDSRANDLELAEVRRIGRSFALAVCPCRTRPRSRHVGSS